MSLVSKISFTERESMRFPFASRVCLWNTLSSPKGSRYQSIFEEHIKDGKKFLVVVGKDDRKDFIEKSKAETLIDNIIRRYQNGDVFALSRAQGFYGDVTGMPSNLAEAQKILISLEKKFNSLPLEKRQKFDNSFDTYVKTVSSYTVDEFNEHFGLNSNQNIVTNTNEGGDSVE